MRKHAEIPDSWWRVACETIHHPVACIGPDHRFVWVNGAFERLLGYSLAELRSRTWMDITLSDDVHGTLQSVQSILEGNHESFSLAKRYRHKQGEEVSVLVSWWKFPREIASELACFIVESLPKTCTEDDMDQCRKEVFAAVDSLRKEVLEHLSVVDKARRQRHERSHRDSDDRDDNSLTTRINIGNNNPNLFYWVVMALAIGFAGLGYIAYLATWQNHQGEAKPPQAPIPTIMR